MNANARCKLLEVEQYWLLAVKDTAITNYSADIVSNETFGTDGDEVNFKLHYAWYYYDKLIFESFNSVTSTLQEATNSVGEVNVDITEVGKDRFSMHKAMQSEVTVKYSDIKVNFTM